METNKDILKAVANTNAYADRVCELVKTIVASHYKLPVTAYNGKSRKRPVIKMKQSSVYFMRKFLPKVTLEYIGEKMGYDHATVLYHIRTVTNLIEVDKETKNDIAQIEQALQVNHDSINLNGDLRKEYYFVDMTNCASVPLGNKQAVVLCNFNTGQIDEFMGVLKKHYNNDGLQARKHKNTGLFILEEEKEKDEPK